VYYKSLKQKKINEKEKPGAGEKNPASAVGVNYLEEISQTRTKTSWTLPGSKIRVLGRSRTLPDPDLWQADIIET